MTATETLARLDVDQDLIEAIAARLDLRETGRGPARNGGEFAADVAAVVGIDAVARAGCGGNPAARRAGDRVETVMCVREP